MVVRHLRPPPRPSLLIATSALLLLAACGSDSPSATPSSLTPEAARGQQLAVDAGCAACHGGSGEGGIGPAWIGLAGSTVELADGRTVVADREYLRRAILDPAAEQVAGSTIAMPPNQLSPAEADALVAYIEGLHR